MPTASHATPDAPPPGGSLRHPPGPSAGTTRYPAAPAPPDAPPSTAARGCSGGPRPGGRDAPLTRSAMHRTSPATASLGTRWSDPAPPDDDPTSPGSGTDRAPAPPGYMTCRAARSSARQPPPPHVPRTPSPSPPQTPNAAARCSGSRRMPPSGTCPSSAPHERTGRTHAPATAMPPLVPARTAPRSSPSDRGSCARALPGTCAEGGRSARRSPSPPAQASPNDAEGRTPGSRRTASRSHALDAPESRLTRRCFCV